MRFPAPATPEETLHSVRRRPRPSTPWKRLRLGAASPGGGATVPFPGIGIPEPEGKKPRAFAGLTSILLHGLIIAVLVVLASLAPEEEEEEIIRVELIREIPAPAPDPAPARRALAERRSVNFAPAAQAVAPQVELLW